MGTFAGNAHFSRVPRVLTASLTVKIRIEIAEHFLPSDLPSKMLDGIAPRYAGGAHKHLTVQGVSEAAICWQLVFCARKRLIGKDIFLSKRSNSLPLNRLQHL